MDQTDATPQQTTVASEPAPQEVKIADINMPFWHLTFFLVKLALAAIPAVIIFSITIFLIVLVASTAFAAITVGTTSFMRAARDPLLLATATSVRTTTSATEEIPATPRPQNTPTISPDSYNLALVSVSDHDTGTEFTVEGSFSNSGVGPSPDFIVVVTFRDPETITERTEIATIPAIQPGQNSEFTVTLPYQGSWNYSIEIKSAGTDRQLLKYRDIAP